MTRTYFTAYLYDGADMDGGEHDFDSLTDAIAKCVQFYKRAIRPKPSIAITTAVPLGDDLFEEHSTFYDVDERGDMREEVA